MNGGYPVYVDSLLCSVCGLESGAADGLPEAESGSMSDTPSPTERVYERHLDLLLAQELECNDTFFQWFLNQCSERPLYDAALANGS